MKLPIEIFVREHASGHFTVRLIGDPSISVYTTDLDRAREEIALLIGDRVERSHPRRQSSFSPPYDFRHETLALSDAVPVFDEDRISRMVTRVSVLVAERRPWRNLWFPRFDLHYFVPMQGADWQVLASELLTEHFKSMKDSLAIAARYDRKEWTETVHVDATPPPLTVFTGKYAGLDLLPLPAEERARELLEEKSKAASTPAGRRKGATPTFRQIGVPLFELAEVHDLERAVARQREIDELYRILCGKGERCMAIVGPPGVGKSTVLNELVYRICDPETSPELRDRRVWFADASRLVAGQGWFGDWQRQVLDAVEECEETQLIWYIGDLLPLLDAGKHINSDQNVSQVLKPFLHSRRITVIGECSERSWSQLELRDAGFARLFSPYRLEEPPADESRTILDGVAASLKEIDGVSIDADGLDTAAHLCRRYAAEGSRTGAAAHFLRRLVERAAARSQTQLSQGDVVAHFCGETGLPEALVRDDQPLDPVEVRAQFELRLIGQPQVVQRVTDLIAVIKTGLSDLDKPLGSFLFVGPTGVGKTETAKALAEFLFADEQRLTRFDMSEYVGFDAVHRFLGTADQEGKLVEAIRRQPFCVVLLDEIEKADGAIFDLLLQILGEARLTDESGRTADFKNAVVIMTSNLGVDSFKRAAGFANEDLAKRYEKHFLSAAEGFFRPELFNRIDHIIPFVPLGDEAIGIIAKRELDKFMRREGIRQRSLTLDLHPDLTRWLSDRGVDLRYGARPLKRAIERKLAIPLARHLAKRKDNDGRLLAAPAGEVIGFEMVEGPRSGEAAKSPRDKVGALLSRIDWQQFLLDRWMQCSDYLDLARELRLIEQLSRNPRFWQAGDLARRRTANLTGMQALRERFERLKEQLGTIEDLGFEAYYDRDVGPLGDLDQELAVASGAVADLELDLYARRFVHPEDVTMYCVAANGSDELLRGLVRIYAEIAAGQGWRMAIFVAIPDEAAPERRKPAAPAAPAAPDLSDKPADPDKRTSRKRDRRRVQKWTWSRLATLEPEPDEAAEPATLRARFVADRVQPETMVVALGLSGPRVGSLLAGEGGVHQEIAGNQMRSVQVHVFDRPATMSTLPHPADVPGRTERARVIHRNKRIVDAPRLNSHVALERRIAPLYRKFMLAEMYRVMLGDQAVPWSRRRELD